MRSHYDAKLKFNRPVPLTEFLGNYFQAEGRLEQDQGNVARGQASGPESEEWPRNKGAKVSNSKFNLYKAAFHGRHQKCVAYSSPLVIYLAIYKNTRVIY